MGPSGAEIYRNIELFSRIRSKGFPFISGGLGVELCLPTVGLAFACTRRRSRYCVDAVPLGGL